MPAKLEGEDVSLWVKTTPQTNYPVLTDNSTVYDVVIVGGGITGIVAAYYMQQQGLQVALIEKNRLAEWTTGSTTAKLSSQHYLIYDYLIKQQGEAAAKAFAAANQGGIDAVERLSQQLKIDCDFSRRSAYVYSQQDDKTDAIKAEVEAASLLGLPASFETEIDLPYKITAAIKFADQAQFHPRKFLLGLAEYVVSNGGDIFEQTEATDIEPGATVTVKTNHGDIKGRAVLQASGEPFWHNDLFDGFMWIKMSYALGVRLKDGESYPQSMYITTDDPMRTLRSADYEGKPVLIFGGESHEYDEATYDADLHYRHLIEDVHKNFNVDTVLFRWQAGDYMPYDRMPYIGALPDHPNIYTITGYRAWGLAWAMSATQAITDELIGKPAEWALPFRLDRLSKPLTPAQRAKGL